MDNLSIPLVIAAYQQGIFPMADAETGKVDWYTADPRAILPLDNLRISRSLRQTIRKKTFHVTRDKDFEAVIRKCADRTSTWISEEIIRTFCELHKLGYAHSVETWNGPALVGGLYGMALGGAFFGESMFHSETDASKVALAGLVAHMKERGMMLLDIQFMTNHLESMGAIEITRDEYLNRLESALTMKVTWK